MSKINIASNATALATGLLQLSSGVAMSATLVAVTDQGNTASQLKLSTTLTQIAGTLQIALNGGSYLDAQDTTGIDRFNINRASASQQVNLDFSSNPSAGTDAVGAIRTYADGVSLSEAVTVLRNGNVGVGTTAPGFLLDVKKTTASQAQFYGFYNGSSSNDHGSILIGSNGSYQGVIGYSGAGGKLFIENIYANNGAQLNLRVRNTSALIIDALTALGSGNVGINETAPTARLQVKGSGSTSATTGLLVQNSAGTSSFKVDDDLSTYVNVGASGTVRFANAADNINISFTGNGSGWGLISGGGVRHYIRNSEAGRFDDTNAWVIGKNADSHVSAINEISSTTRGFLPPRMTTAQKNAIATPAAGLMLFDTTLNKLCVYTTAWETITSV